MVLAAPVMLIFRDKVFAELAAQHMTVPHGAFVAAVVAILLMIAGMAAMAFLWVRHLRRIVDTVGQGDPFIPLNAVRLRAMAWLTIGIEAISVPIGALVLWIGTVTEGNDVDFGLSFGGVLLALVLFILARVFRKGAEMRAELEGTV